MEKEREVLLSASTVRGLNDKVYEKRKAAALDIERQIKEYTAMQDIAKVGRMLGLLKKDFIESSNPNARKGGLIGLAATAIGLGVQNITNFVEELVPPVMAMFNDTDSRVRYYACEAMYNVCKIARSDILVFFNEVYDGLSKLAADADPNVKNGAELLDRLMKDIVTETTNFDVEKFIPLIKDRIHAVIPSVRQFHVSWIATLDAVPSINLLVFLPDLLGGLMKILSDPTRDIRAQTEALLAEFLREIVDCKGEDVDVASMMPILVSNSKAHDELMKFTALQWLIAFMQLSEAAVIPYSPELLGSVLPSLARRVDATNESRRQDDIRDLAVTANKTLLKIISQTSQINGLPEEQTTKAPGVFPLLKTIEVLMHQLQNTSEDTRCAAFHWILMLHTQSPTQIISCQVILFPALLKSLSDASDFVVELALQVVAKVCSFTAAAMGAPPQALEPHLKSYDAYPNFFFCKFMESLIDLFSSDGDLLHKRGAFIFRKLCLLLNPVDIFSVLADILLVTEDLTFASLMVQTLNVIILTSVELHAFRSSLNSLQTQESKDLFIKLYKTWCHNPVSTLSLCLLTQSYEHSLDLVLRFGHLNLTVKFLLEIDKLVQLIESPIYAYLRLQLLEPDNYTSLVKSMYGLLMILPQSNAFHTLRKRLECVPNMFAYLPHKNQHVERKERLNEIPFAELLQHFDAIQQKQTSASLNLLKKETTDRTL